VSDLLHVPGPDGRTIEALVGGDPDGFGLLFHGGSPSAVAAYPPFDEAARALGLRLVTLSRPGYGGSTPRPAPGRYADDVVESVAVLDHLDIGEFITLGWSGGGPRALACAALLPDRCRAAASLAGVAPYLGDGLDWFAGMAEAMGGLVTPVDKAMVTDEFADWMSRTFNAAGAQGAIGVRDDGIAAVSPWGFDLADIRVPVAIWQGRQDAMVPFGHAEWLATHVPGAEAHLFEDEGHLSLVGRIEEILGDLKRLAGR
jgi:pimeloyl-ACP methyl ester carboxylesterase